MNIFSCFYISKMGHMMTMMMMVMAPVGRAPGGAASSAASNPPASSLPATKGARAAGSDDRLAGRPSKAEVAPVT